MIPKNLKMRNNMKNKIGLVICVFLVLFSLQVLSKSITLYTHYGFKTGIVNSNIESDFFYENRTKTGGDFAFFVESNTFKKRFKLISEVHYTQKGMIDAYVEFNPVTYEIINMTEYKHRLDYLSIPVLLKVFKEYEIITPYILIGPRFDYLFNFRSEVYQELLDEVNVFVIGADMAIGSEIFISNKVNGIFELRYSYDITYSEDQFNSKNKSFQILMGMKFPIVL